MQRERERETARAVDREGDKEGGDEEGEHCRRVGYPVEWSRNHRCHLTTRRRVANANETQTVATAATLTATPTATAADKARPQKGKTHKAKRNLIARQRRD